MKTDRRVLAGRYLLEAPVASGGVAEVWRARDQVLDRPVAVKILHDSLAEDPEVLERFKREAIMAAHLSHAGIVRVFDTGTDDGSCFIVMELLEGVSVAELLRQGPVSPSEAVRIVRGVLEGLAHAHERGVIHRDMKPDNVLLQGSRVKVTDFGIAHAAFTGRDITATGELLGTADYLAPEQIDGGTTDPRADLYAVGVILYELLTGRTPFRGETSLAAVGARLTQDPPSPRNLRAGIPRDLEAVTMRALARDPDDRFGSAEDMIGALDRCSVAGDDPEPRPLAVRPDAEHPSFFRSWMLVPLILAGVVAVVVVAGLLVGSLEIGGPLGVRPNDKAPPPAAASASEPIELAGVSTHDPLGDGDEHGENAPLAIDGDLETSWATEGYESADLGGIKDGVGLVLDLGTSREITEVRLSTPLPGWRFELHTSEDGETFAPARSSEGGTGFVAEEETTIALPSVPARYLMVWVTELVASDRYRAEVAEIELAGV